MQILFLTLLPGIKQVNKVKIGIIGYYGFNNLGDELNLQCMMENLKRQYENTDFLIFSDCNQIEGEVNYKIFGKNYFSPFYKSAKEAMNNCDLLIIGGGGLIYLGEYWFPFMNEGINVPYVVYRVGIDDRKIDEKAINSYKKLFLQAKEITVRDTYSKNLCNKYLNLDVPIIPEAIWNHPYQSNRTDYKNCKKIGINLRSFSEEVFPTLREFFTKLSNKRYELYFIPCQIMKSNPNLNDNKFHRLVAPRNSYIVPDNSPIKERCELISKMDICIGMRLHFVLLSLIERIPVLALNYNNKVKGLMDEIGLGEYIVDLNNNLLNSLENNFEKLKREKNKIKYHLNLQVPVFKEGAKKFILEKRNNNE